MTDENNFVVTLEEIFNLAYWGTDPANHQMVPLSDYIEERQMRNVKFDRPAKRNLESRSSSSEAVRDEYDQSWTQKYFQKPLENL